MTVGFDPGVLTSAERIVLASVTEGVPAQLGGTGSRAVRAAFLKHLLLRLPVPDRAEGWPVQLTGVLVEDAWIEGALDLSGAAMPGSGLPTLAFIDCDIPGPMNFEAARLSSLSLAGSRFREIILREAEIDGPLDFSGVKPFGASGGLAWIDAGGAIINGRLSGIGAHLRAPGSGDNANTRQGQRIVALRLSDADIRGSIVLIGGFVADGGVSLDNARVHGDVRMRGATVTAAEEDALSVQNARIDGMAALNDRFTALGAVWLYGTSIGGCLFLSRAELCGGSPVSESGGPLAALVAENADIGGPLFLNGTIAQGQVRLTNVRIRGSIEADGASLRYPLRESAAVSAEGIVVGNDLLLRGSMVDGTLDLTGASIGGRLALHGTQLLQTLGLGQALGRVARGQDNAALLAVNATVSGNAKFRPVGDPGQRAVFCATGKLDLTGVRIVGDALFNECRLAKSGDPRDMLLSAERARIDGSLEFERKFVANRQVTLAAASIGRDLRCRGARFANTGAIAIEAKNLTVGNDLQLLVTAVEGNLRFERVSISGSLKWYGLSISGSDTGGRTPLFDLRHARVGTALKAERLVLRSQAFIDLGGMRVANLQDWNPRGWGIGGGIEGQISFDGFQCDRIEFTREWPASRNDALRREFGIPWYGPPRHPRGDPLLDWIVHQRRSGADEASFFPQPFRQLARVLRSQGEEEAAVMVAVAERWAAFRDESPSLFRWIFGIFFGFGLLKWRATAVLAGYIASGMIGVEIAQSKHMLVEAMVVTAPAFTHPFQGGETRVFISAPLGLETVPDILCTDTASGLLVDALYAMDMIIPAFQLHQEAKCEIKPGLESDTTGWLVARAIYSVVGWLVVALSLGTLSGLLGRVVGGGEA